jgi:Cu2+-exporting ATPase
VFDKTGTLTHGRLSVRSVVPLDGRSESEVSAIAAALEAGSEHPITLSFTRSWQPADRRQRHHQHAGTPGSRSTLDGRTYAWDRRASPPPASRHRRRPSPTAVPAGWRWPTEMN